MLTPLLDCSSYAVAVIDTSCRQNRAEETAASSECEKDDSRRYHGAHLCRRVGGAFRSQYASKWLRSGGGHWRYYIGS